VARHRRCQEKRAVRPRPNHGSKTANQQALAHAFLGVAMQRSRSGETAPVRVATTGVFEFDCAENEFELGDLIGADENAAHTAC